MTSKTLILARDEESSAMVRDSGRFLFLVSKSRLLPVTAFVAAVLGAATSARAQAVPELIPGRYIVTLHEQGGNDNGPGDLRNVDAVSNRNGVSVIHKYGYARKGFAADLTPAALQDLRNDARVANIEQDQVVRLRGKPGSGGSTPTQPAQTIPWGIQRIAATSSSTASGNGAGSVDVDVAIIDTGIDTTHPDLNVVGGRNFTSRTATNYADGNGHGTHVAGTVAAKDNSIGVVGVAPGARLWAVRVLDSTGSGTMSGVIAGVDWVTANASTIEVANM
ncbi:MAG: S8 family serine peptidase, partial [bacterium]